MIIKNEEPVLVRCLNCVKQFADEIVIVDTGSNDKSKEIAQNFTSKVYDFTWCDDFSKARNFAFSKGTSDYLMWLDADDVISQEDIKKINLLKSLKTDVDIFMCKYAMDFKNFSPALTYNRERIVKRSANFQWVGFVHEVIVPSGKIEYTDIEIRHQKEVPSPPKRNLKLYEKALKRGEKFDARQQYYYARELFQNGYISKAARALSTFLKMPNSYPPDNFEAYLFLSDCHQQKGNLSKALKTLFVCLEKHLPNGQLCCKIAFIYDKLKSPEQAIFWFKAALASKPNSQGFVYMEFQKLVPCIELSRLLFHSNYPAAKAYHKIAKNISPKHPAIVFNEQFFIN